jgi:hypothetical protein
VTHPRSDPSCLRIPDKSDREVVLLADNMSQPLTNRVQCPQIFILVSTFHDLKQDGCVRTVKLFW